MTSDEIEYTHKCPDCGATFATDPVYCTYCDSWDVEEIDDAGGDDDA